MKYKDISGQRFGKLVAISYAGDATALGLKQPAPMWNCDCDCGNSKIVRGTALRRGHIASCGCEKLTAARKAKPVLNDITGQRFGMLTVMFKSRSTGKPNGQRSRWVCQCDCGSKTLVRGKDLVHGTTTSCGCKKRTPRHDLTGQRFGNLTAVKLTGKSAAYGGRYWECLCDCGATAYVPTGSLKSGNTKSCGCSRRRSVSP